jgi:mono/diheme cytochrome c family protein
MHNPRRSNRRLILVWTAAIALPAAAASAFVSGVPAAKRVAGAPAKLQYNRDVRPILMENCFACHGPDSAARKADLRLDRPQDAYALKNGRAAIVKGNPSQSEVVKRIEGKGPLMPPVSSHKTLTPKQIATLKAWVAQGAEYQAHWSFIPPTRPALPAVKDAKWVRNPIDRFVLARLEAAGLKPAPEADRRTLARRLSLDLTGLPPDPADVERFVNDKSPDAYEKLVDKFLASPHWGEHRGRYWLDAARYADTHGIHFDNYREMWSYRDWVVKAFNRNIPFDQFTIEQLAGDLLPKPDLDQLVATGFNRCNITTNEGGVIQEEYKVLYARDRTETTSAVWLGLTTGCATCHDHKFDPVSQREFYELSAFFNNTTQPVMDGNIKDTPPIIPVPLDEDRPRFEALKLEIADAKAKVEARKTAAREDFNKWRGGASAEAVVKTIPANGLKFHAPLSEGQGREVTATADGQPVKAAASADPAWAAGHVGEKAYQKKAGVALEFPQAGDFEKDQPFTVSAWVKVMPNQGGALVSRMDEGSDYRGWDLWTEGSRVGTHIVNKWPMDALKVVSREPLKANTWQHVTVSYDGSAKPAGIKVYIDGARKDTETTSDTLKSTIRTTVPLKIGQRSGGATVDGAGIQDVRLYGRVLAQDEVQRLAQGTRAAWLASRGVDKLAAAETDELFNWWLTGSDTTYGDLNKKVAALQAEESAIRMRGTIAHIQTEKPGEATAHVLFRGEYDKRREEVKAATPAVLPPMPKDLPRNRLGFAKWLLREDHPLTARVTVNRFWQEVFGQGLVRTTGDFGVSGETPSHPELLDWMAVEFREKGWDMKKFFKLLVTSATYRQAATVTADKRLKDGDNRLLSRGPRFRMDAEVIRDYALAASGLLVRKLGGASVRPYQPDGVWEAVAMPESNTRNYKADTGESLYRRSVYTFWKRAAPPASMDIFNATAREVCTVRRERTNTPLQALVTMNDIQFVEAARKLAEQALKTGGATTEARVDFIARRLMSRPLAASEMEIVAKSLAKLEAHYKQKPDEAKALVTFGESKADAGLNTGQLAAWTMLTNQMMNLDEVLNK